MADKPFSEVLKLLEDHGWVLQRRWPPYFVFIKEGELPLLIPVYEKKVSEVYVEKIEKILDASR